MTTSYETFCGKKKSKFSSFSKKKGKKKSALVMTTSYQTFCGKKKSQNFQVLVKKKVTKNLP